MRLFRWMLFALVVATVLMAIPVRAQTKAVMEGVAASRYTIKVDTSNARVEVDTTSYSGGIASVGLYTTSNVVVGTNANRNSAVLYATGTLTAQEAALTATGAAQYDLTLSTGMRFFGVRTGIVWQDGSVSTTAASSLAGSNGAASTQTIAAVNDNFLSSVNGSQTAFTLSQSPASTSTVRLHRDGLVLMNPDDYTMTGTVINTAVAPAANTSEFWAGYLVYTSTYPGLLQSGAGAGGDLSGTYPNPNFADHASNTLIIDGANHRVGVGTASPSTKLEVNGGVTIDANNDLNVSGTGGVLFNGSIRMSGASGSSTTCNAVCGPNQCIAEHVNGTGFTTCATSGTTIQCICIN